MMNLSEARQIALSIARHYQQHAKDRPTQARVREIRRALETDFSRLVPGDVNRVAPQMRAAYLEWRDVWMDTSLSADRLSAVEREIEAAWALTAALNVVSVGGSNYHRRATSNPLSDIFGRDMETERRSDAREVRLADEYPDLSVPTTASMFGLVIALLFEMTGISDSFSSFVGGASLLGLGFCFFAWRDSKPHKQRALIIKEKWDGRPDRTIPFLND